MNPDPKALLRTELIVKVRAGLMTATAAAEALGVSRKTYYKWEKRGLSAMLAAGQDEAAGRPSKEAKKEVKDLRRKVKTLSAKLDEVADKAELRLMLRILELKDAKKKERQSNGSSP